MKGAKRPKTETDSNWDPTSPSKKSVLDAVSTPQSASSLSTTVASTPGNEVSEVAPPTPGSRVTRDPAHPYMPTPVRTSQAPTTTPADGAKKAGENDGHPMNLH